MGFFRQEYWSGWPSHPPGDCPNLGIEPGSAALQAVSLLLNQQGSPPFHSRCSHCQFRRCNRHGFDPCVGKIPGRRKMRPTSILAWKIPWTEEPGRLQSWLSDWACVHGIQAAMFIWRWQCEIWMTEFEWNQRARRENRIPTYQRLRVENTGECR